MLGVRIGMSAGEVVLVFSIKRTTSQEYVCLISPSQWAISAGIELLTLLVTGLTLKMILGFYAKQAT